MFRSTQHQRGQALIYGIFVMLGGLTALYFVFNTGQLSSEKTKLVNTADAVAYSAGVMQARALNFDAYNNRALVANEVLVAQMVSLSSWGQYVDSHALNLLSVFPLCVSTDPQSFAFSVTQNYDFLYALACVAAAAPGVNTALIGSAQSIQQGASAAVTLIESSKSAIRSAQALLHAPMYFQRASMGVMREVADRNYAGDGTVRVAAFIARPVGGAPGPLEMLNDFTKRYADGQRTRFAEVARPAADSDEFVRVRGWTAEAAAPPIYEWKCVLKNRKNSVRRRGGTELINLDEWKAEDTESFWRMTNAGGVFNRRCNSTERPIGFGEQQAHPPDGDQDESGASLGGSPATNPRASGRASSAEWSSYSGLPSFYDLSDLVTLNPVMQFDVRLTRDAASTRTSGGASAIVATPRLNNFQNNFADGVMTALASGEVFFERPLTDPAAPGLGNFNQRAESAGSPDRREIGSLFNPYWQVRLMQGAP